MTQPNPSIAMARAVVDELARGGVSLVVVSPGSRSTALVVAAAEHPLLDLVTSIDERSAAFHALGWGKATGLPAALICTSGTAPANYLPAIVEAGMSLTPLIALTADRPAELQGVGANQTIDQKELFGRHVRSFAHLEAPHPKQDANADWRRVASETVAASKGSQGSPGPAHLNMAFREPTVAVTDDGRTEGHEFPFGIDGRPDGVPWLSEPLPQPPPTQPLELPGGRGLIIAGEGEYDRDALKRAGEEMGWPLLATALSGMRGEGMITGYHHLLADGVPSQLRPEIVFAVGSIGPSQRLEALVGSASIRVRVDYWGRRIDPLTNATHILHADPSALLGALASEVEPVPGWSEVWLAADSSMAAAIDASLSGTEISSGAAAARFMGEAGWETLVVASSLPVREVDAHLRRGGRVIGNRGASGIDGFTSMALGVARAAPGVAAIAGDLSLLHDSNGLLIKPLPDLVIVVLDNDGGGLFDNLPQSRHAPRFEKLFVVPHGRDLRHLAELHGAGYTEVGTGNDLVRAVDSGLTAGGVHVIRVPLSRSVDLAVRQSLDRIGSEVGSGFDT